ncbi:hypothetical protein H9P43_008286 [Blastocladiella emersonii ATCC 22665]|nr:hypothetical protein H9P43_008286 [Blastocladiella emersonii ATCC 22665]
MTKPASADPDALASQLAYYGKLRPTINRVADQLQRHTQARRAGTGASGGFGSPGAAATGFAYAAATEHRRSSLSSTAAAAVPMSRRSTAGSTATTATTATNDDDAVSSVGGSVEFEEVHGGDGMVFAMSMADMK